ncbi:MAG: hypothetical protein GXP47_05135 [Acidobacteria bacterium]|nr:hypothetical protein [Acidobacteriota bacterium]
METSQTLRDALKPFVRVRLDVPLGEDGPEVRRFKISFVPTIVIEDASDREIDRIIGYGGPRSMGEHIEKILRGDTFDRWFAGYRAQTEHSREEVEKCVRRLARRGLYGEAVAEAENEGLAKLSKGIRDLVMSARLEAFAMLYDEAADGGRKSGWTRLDLPEDPAEVAGPGLVGLVFASQHHHLEVGGALRRALREARSTDADRMARFLLENAQGWGSRRKLLRLARMNGCREAVMLLIKGVTYRGVDRLEESGQVADLLRALITVQGAPEMGERLAEHLLGLCSDPIDLMLAARARYLAGRRQLAAQTVRQVQRDLVRHGALRVAHCVGEERRAMAEGRWPPPPPWIAHWPKP